LARIAGCNFTFAAGRPLPRRRALPPLAGLAWCGLWTVAAVGQQPAPPSEPIRLTEAARRLHADALVIDGHNDLPWALRKQADGSFDRLDIALPQPSLQTDLPKLRAGGVRAQFWSVWVPGETALRGAALATTIEQIELVQAMVRRYPDALALATTADDVERIAATGKIASLIGVEGGHCIENSLGALRRLHALGARYMTLTHTEGLDWADSATDDERHGGLTHFGEQVVAEMNRLGMMVDLSHVSPAAMRHVLRVAQAPVIFSHSSARGVADHPRNVPDDVLPLVARNGGVVMVNFYAGFLHPRNAQREARRMAQRRVWKDEGLDDAALRKKLRAWDLEHPAERGDIRLLGDHIDHVVRLAGVDHVGLGSDFDGVTLLPEQLEDASRFPYVTQLLLDRGYAESDIRKILGGNLLRVLRAVEAAAER